MKDEVLRKLVHLSSLTYPILYFFCTKKEMILLVFFITLFVIVGDLIRVKSTCLNKIFSTILRDSEKNGGFSGATFFMIGTLLTVTLFPKMIAIMALCVLVISDTAAAIFGKLIHSKKIVGGKSVAGCLAFFISSSLIVLFFKSPILIISCLVTTIAELFAKKLHIDDNILIPISFSIVSYLLI